MAEEKTRIEPIEEEETILPERIIERYDEEWGQRKLNRPRLGKIALKLVKEFTL